MIQRASQNVIYLYTGQKIIKASIIRPSISLMDKTMNKMKLSPCGLGCALGVLWGVSVFIMGLIATYYAYGKPFVHTLSLFYLGYAPNLFGSFLGGIIGFIDAFIGGVILAWLYNAFSGHCSKKHDRKK